MDRKTYLEIEELNKCFKEVPEDKKDNFYGLNLSKPSRTMYI